MNLRPRSSFHLERDFPVSNEDVTSLQLTICPWLIMVYITAQPGRALAELSVIFKLAIDPTGLLSYIQGNSILPTPAACTACMW